MERYYQAGVQFDPNWIYGFQSGMATRSGKVVYTFPVNPSPQLVLKSGVTFVNPTKLTVQPYTPVLLARYTIHLKSGEQSELDFKMPVHPVAITNSSAINQLQSLSITTALASARAWWWQQVRGEGLQLSLSEKKVVNTFRASLMYLMLARDRWPATHAGGQPNYIQAVNKLQYHAFWMRDTSYMIHAYDLTGHATRAAQCLNYVLNKQKHDGNYMSQRGQHDGWGETLWAIGQHYQLTGDLNFARKTFPHVHRAVAWLENARMHDSLHLLPGGDPHDDEFPHTFAHITGDNFYALDGLHEAILLAKALGHTDTAAAWQKQYEDYHHTVFQRLREIGLHDGDYITPGLDVKGGHDWGNLLALYPYELLNPIDPLVTGTLRHAVREYGEGLMTWGIHLHHYLTMNNTEAWIIRGQQRSALRDLYSILVHTSATQSGWEVGPPAWTTRDYQGDLAPHGWFAADYIALVRNMLLREQNNTLELFSVLSPSWTKPGDILSLRNAPTRFGTVNLWATFATDGMQLHIESHFRTPPSSIQLHFPWYVTVTGASVDGHQMPVSGQSLTLPPSVQTVHLQWNRQTDDLSNWNYVAFVKRFKKAWQSMYFGGKPLPFGNGLESWPK